jgi:hypothetical protein
MIMRAILVGMFCICFGAGGFAQTFDTNPRFTLNDPNAGQLNIELHLRYDHSGRGGSLQQSADFPPEVTLAGTDRQITQTYAVHLATVEALRAEAERLTQKIAALEAQLSALDAASHRSLEALGGELVRRMGTLPLDVVRDDRAYAILLERLRKDLVPPDRKEQ